LERIDGRASARAAPSPTDAAAVASGSRAASASGDPRRAESGQRGKDGGSRSSVPGRLAVDPPLATLDPLVDPHRVIVDQHGTIGPACPPRPATLGPTPSKPSRRDCSAPTARRCGARRAVAPPPWP